MDYPDDPMPQPPEPPLDNACCESDCGDACVWSRYGEALAEYRQALSAWQQRHPEGPTDQS